MSILASLPDTAAARRPTRGWIGRFATACAAGFYLTWFSASLDASVATTTARTAGADIETRLSRIERLARRDPPKATEEIARLDPSTLSPADSVRLAVARSTVALFESRLDEVLAETALNLPRARALAAPASIAALLINHGTALDWKSRGFEARQALDEAMVWADRSRDADLRVDVRLLLMQSAAQQGRFEDGFALLEVADDIATRSGGLSPQAGVAMSRALMLRLIGDLAGALKTYEIAESAYRKDDDPRGEMDALMHRASVLTEAGRFDDARLPQQRALAYFRQQGQTLIVAVIETDQAVGLSTAGNSAAALRLIQQATRTLRDADAGPVLASALVAQMNMLSTLGRPSEAAALIPEIQGLIKGSEDLKLQANLHESRATALAALGRHREAYDALREGQQILARLDDTKLSRQAAAQRGRAEGKRIATELEQALAAADAERAARDRAEQRGRWLWHLISFGLLLLGTAGLALLLLATRSRRDSALAKVDFLTGVSNRRRITEMGETLLARCQSTDQTFSLILIDIDHFKAINDQYGHATGDRVLKEVAAALKRPLRQDNELGRFGGEEFSVLLPGVTSTEAVDVAERLRKAVEALTPDRLGIATGLTISAGVATATRRDSFIGVMARADEALYRAKDAGRNRVHLDEIQTSL